MPTPTFRDAIRIGSPPWLRRGNNQKLLFAFGLLVDVLGTVLQQGVRSRFPGYKGDYQSLPLLGRERRIPRGRLESDENYAARLEVWLDAHRHRGGPYALLDQLHKHYADASGVAFPIELIYRSGRRFSMAADGSVVMDDVADWNPGNPAEQWATITLLYYTDDLPVATADDLNDLRMIPVAWNAAHVLGQIIIMPTGASFFDALDPAELFDGGDALFDATVAPIVVGY